MAEQEPALATSGGQWTAEPAARAQAVQPCARHALHAGTYVDEVRRACGEVNPRRRMDHDRRPLLQARARGRRQRLVDLERCDAAHRADQLRQNGRVVAGAGADVDDRLAGLRRAGMKTARVQAR